MILYFFCINDHAGIHKFVHSLLSTKPQDNNEAHGILLQILMLIKGHKQSMNEEQRLAILGILSLAQEILLIFYCSFYLYFDFIETLFHSYCPAFSSQDPTTLKLFSTPKHPPQHTRMQPHVVPSPLLPLKSSSFSPTPIHPLPLYPLFLHLFVKHSNRVMTLQATCYQELNTPMWCCGTVRC